MKLRYGISIESARQLNELPAASTAEFLELSSALCDSAELSVPSAWQKKIRRFNGRHEAHTLNSLIGAGSGVMVDFFREFTRRCSFFASLGAEEVVLEIDWETAFSRDEYSHSLQKILHCCFGITARFNLRVLLALRIPGNAVNFPAKFLDFRNSLMYPVRTLIDLHPHEPGALECFAAFAAAMPFECDSLRITFDAANGNYLSGKLLEVIRQSIRQVGVDAPYVCFAPGKYAGKELFASLEAVMI